ncbi:MAG: hypothetical protein ACTSX7_01680 [Alphaproteobacteria bacterium]
MYQDSPFLSGLSPVTSLEIRARFDGGALLCGGGVLVPRAIELGLKYADRM